MELTKACAYLCNYKKERGLKCPLRFWKTSEKYLITLVQVKLLVEKQSGTRSNMEFEICSFDDVSWFSMVCVYMWCFLEYWHVKEPVCFLLRQLCVCVRARTSSYVLTADLHGGSRCMSSVSVHSTLPWCAVGMCQLDKWWHQGTLWQSFL